MLNQIHNENCLDTMKRMPDNFVDLVITSPPYDDMRTYNGYSFEFEKIAMELSRVIKQGGVIIWIVNDATIDGTETLTSFKQAIYFKEVCGLNVHDTMFYGKRNYMPSNQNRYCQQVEYCFVFSKGKPKTFNGITEKSIHAGKVLKRTQSKNYESASNTPRANITAEQKLMGNYWEYDVGTNCSTKDEVANKHPAIFPEKLVQDHIFTWSNEGEIVYDCFGGSGTVAKMAHLQKRQWIMSEISEDYCNNIAEKRVSSYTAQTFLF